jgi:hypothetical protein
MEHQRVQSRNLLRSRRQTAAVGAGVVFPSIALHADAVIE